MLMRALPLEGGFNDGPRDAAAAFRSLMNAMARPGTIAALSGAEPPAPLSRAAGALLLTLTDVDTPLHLAGQTGSADVGRWIAFHTGAPLTGPSNCMFAVGTWDDLAPLGDYPVGTPEFPERSSTLIVECNAIAAAGTELRGPGIRGTAQLSLPDPKALRANHELFPMGLDFFFTAGNDAAALPRSTEIGRCT